MTDVAATAAREQAAIEAFRVFLRENRDELRLVAHWGDGHGAYLLSVPREELGVVPTPRPPNPNAKKVIPRRLAKRVFERDGYRCVTCGDHHDLTCDHITPESKGGQATFENLQTMCRPCNSRKGTKA